MKERLRNEERGTTDGMGTPESASSAGTTRPAGEGISDEAAAAEVAAQTSSDLKAEEVFKRESDGATTDKAADQTSADDLA